MAASLVVVGCHRPPILLPGSTDTSVRSVRIESATSRGLAVDYSKLYQTLGLRVGSLIRPERKWNQFRLAEDRRRVQAHAQLNGYFEASAAEPEVDRDDKGVAVVWKVDEGPEYRIGEVKIVGAPEGTESMLREMIPFGPGDAIDVAVYRPLRRDLAERLQAEGYGHARVYSRAWADRGAKTVAWYYFVDEGPKTTIGSIEVDGNVRVPADVILRRSGLRVGGEYSTTVKKRAELAVLDGGSIRSIVVRHDADILTGPPQWPDTGGVARVDDQGNMAERDLDPKINVRLVVVEAPARQLRFEAGAEVDPERADAFAGFRALFRDVGAAQNHVVVEGSAGYGWEVGDTGEPIGEYGAALLRYIRASALGRKVDLRVSARFRQDLFPDASVRDLAVGPGTRSVLADKLYFDFDVFAARAESLDFGPFDDTTRDEFSLADDDVSAGARVETALIYDTRNDRIEALRGHLLAARLEVSPGGALGDHRWVRAGADARKFFPLTAALSIAARGSATWVFLDEEEGVPLGARLFGGGSYGFRGFGRQGLSPKTSDDISVGGLSLAEASLEARFLPFRELYGAAAFVDFAGVGADSNPFEDGINGAFGLGLRARTFYVPISIDVSYRLLEESELVGPGDIDRWGLFFRIGEAF